MGFQDDKFFDLVRNENWFGWQDERLTEQHPEDRIDDNESAQRNYTFLNEAWMKAVQGTKLEGRLVVEYDPSAGTQSSKLFRNGQTDLLLAGWSGAIMDPFDLFEVFLSTNYRYAQAFDPEAEKIDIEIAGRPIPLRPWTGGLP